MIELFLKGGPFMWPLLLCSVLTIGYAIERIITYARIRKERDQERIVQEAGSMVENGAGPEEVHKFLDKTGRLEGEALMAGYDRFKHLLGTDRPTGELRAELQETTISAARAYLERNLPVLEFITGGATLLGLLGTISGMIKSFGAIAEKGLGEPTYVAKGISEALITTATGLTIAIPALAIYVIFMTRADRKAVQFEPYGNSFVDALLRSRGKKTE